MIVLDTSAAVDFLLEYEPEATWVAERIEQEAELHAPHVLDIEVLGALRRSILLGILRPERATEALADLQALRIVRYPHTPFLDRAWELRGGLTAPDAVFVALAESLGASLVTTDGRLARGAPTSVRVVAP